MMNESTFAEANLYVMIGISGSGKTYFAHEMAATIENAAVVDIDDIKKEVPNNDAAFAAMEECTIQALKEGKTTFYVATNLSSYRRAELLKAIKKAVPDTRACAIIMATPSGICFMQNQTPERINTVPQDILNKQLDKFQMPLPYENWDAIEVHIAHLQTEKVRETHWKDVVDTIDPTFFESNLYYHLLMTFHAALSENEKPDILAAALYHDWGKTTDGIIYLENGEPRYINSANIGAYWALSMGMTPYAATLINYQTVPRMKKKERRLWKDRCGKTLWNDLSKLRFYDEMGRC